MKFAPYIDLMRLNRPIGIELLLYPTLGSLFLAADAVNARPSVGQIVIFTLGAVLMRSAGCVINDFADRKVDAKVWRTKQRPLASGQVTSQEALGLFLVLVGLSATLLLWLPWSVWLLAPVALVLSGIYPFLKRYTHIPQLGLALAFGMAVYMAAAPFGINDLNVHLLFGAFVLWTLAYDTQYAMADRIDDQKAGIKSTAQLLGRYDLFAIYAMHLMALMLYALVIGRAGGFWLGLTSGLCVLVLIVYQMLLTQSRHPKLCLDAFLHNAWVGRAWFFWVLCAVFA